MNLVENEGKTAIAKTMYTTDKMKIFAKMRPQWLIQYNKDWNRGVPSTLWMRDFPAMANPIQQGLKRRMAQRPRQFKNFPQWLIQYNKDWNRNSLGGGRG